VLRAYRPRQWTKNLLVLAAPCAAGVIDRPLVIAQVAATFVALCLLSSATYLFNDVRDRDDDRRDPRKRLRPVAAGQISPARALAIAAATALAGLAIASAVDVKVGLIGCGYLALTASYSLWWRGVVVLDILVIAAGFVLRALAGGVATDIYLSRWFVIVTASCAVFVVAAKRYAELREHTGAQPARATLQRYSLSSLRLALLAAAAVGATAYVAWAFTRPQNILLYVLSVIPFLALLARYVQLIAAGAGEAPEDLLRDRVMLVLLLAWGLLFLGGVYVGR
jgi:decaprenyl-phosphate phosphoribosyltransferase